MSHARYRISRRLGQGGMAEVFEAELAGELGFVRKVAIKRMLAAAASDPTSASRFLEEARIASRLHHANIVSVLDVGLLDGLPFQVLEHVDGPNVEQLMQRAGGTLSLDVALIIAGDVAHGLDHAHTAVDGAGAALGIVHRDVKPSNALVSWGGDVKLSDFGIAHARDRTMQTEAGVVAGTLGFMAPEQRTRGLIDGRTDVFSLGLTLHAMIAGYTPLQDVTVEMAVIAGHRMELAAGIPADVARVIADAVEPDRRARPTAAQLADAIGAILAPRLMRDRRAVLRDWLATVEGAPGSGGGAGKRAAGGLLDQFLGLDVVLTSAAGAADEPPRYEIRHALAELATVRAGAGVVKSDSVPEPRLLDLLDDPATTARVPLPGERARQRRGARVAVIVLAAAITIAVGIGGLSIWKASSSSAHGDVATPRRGADAGLAVQQVDATVVVVVARVEPDAMEAISIDAPPPPVVGDAAIAVVPPRAQDAAVRPVERDAAITVVAAGTGFLQVVGEDMIGGKVFLDGALVGYPPSKIEVLRGHHSVYVEKKDGTRLAAKAIEVTDLSTIANPVRLTW